MELCVSTKPLSRRTCYAALASTNGILAQSDWGSASLMDMKRVTMKTIRRATELPQSGNVYIFGAGMGGRLIQKVLSKNPMVKVCGFIDNGKSGFMDGLRIYKFSEFNDSKISYDWILIASMYYPEIAQQLKKSGTKNVMNVYSVCQNEVWERRRTIRATITAGFLLVILLMVWL